MRRKRHMVAALAAAMMTTMAGAVYAQTIVGRASVVDGDTIHIGDVTIRLHGIDAPEGRQECLNADGAGYRCGQAAADALDAFLAASRPTSCEPVDVDQYGRTVAVCFGADGIEANAWMVLQGWALDYVEFSHGDYADEEAAARAARRGVWAGTFTPPWDWRRGERLPAERQAAEAAAGDCAIKGNINREGVRIYHVPGSRDYDATVIRPEDGERWFCSVEEAVAAGWRAPR